MESIVAVVIVAILVEVFVGHVAIYIEDNLLDVGEREGIRIATVGIVASVGRTAYQLAVGVVVIIHALRVEVFGHIAHLTAKRDSLH